ncbi:MAG TPA: hypothetical protein VMC10_21875 [Stellaceae bacterium]|nr:hypothetical protein [Stellaceae bacterium]
MSDATIDMLQWSASLAAVLGALLWYLSAAVRPQSDPAAVAAALRRQRRIAICAALVTAVSALLQVEVLFTPSAQAARVEYDTQLRA